MVRLVAVYFLIILKVLAVWGNKPLDYDYHIQVVNGNYSTDMTVTVSAVRESIIHFEDSTSYFPYTVFAWSEKSDADFPVFITLRQQKEPTAWRIPLLVQSREGLLSFRNTSRTLCHNNFNVISKMPAKSRLYINNDESGIRKRLTVSVSTAYDIPTNVTIRVEEQNNFYLIENKNYTVIISPSEPRYFYYKFPDDYTDTESTVFLKVDSLDDTCLIVSIQNATCPVFDLNQDISYEGEYETVSTKGGVIVKQTDFPSGFFVVLVAKGDNFDCDTKMSVIPLQELRNSKPSNHSSLVIFNLTRNIAKDKYLLVTVLTLGGFLMFHVVFGIMYCFFCSSNGYQILHNVEETNPIPSGSSVQREVSTTACAINIEVERSVDIQQSSESPGVTDRVTNENDILERSGSTLFHSINEEIGLQTTLTEVSQEEATDTVDDLLLSSSLHLNDLSKKDPKHIHRESMNYCLHIISIGIFYGIPVVQLVITSQRMLVITGNLDICYYNFRCAHPFIGLMDFNHFLSNVGYLFSGVSFLIITSFHKKMRRDDNCGIPKHYGLFYAMGAALIMEGFLSMCYHVCPNQSTFQFDTTFMFVMAVLCIIKLYQNRHPDINTTAYVAFLILGIAVLIAVFGILSGHIIIWILFIFLYILLCLVVANKIYFVNQWKRGFKLVREVRNNSSIWQAIKPKKRDRYIAVVGVTILNITITIVMGQLCRASNVDFGTFLLGLLMGNAVIYTIIYLIMKAKYKERLSIQSILYLIVAAIFGGFAVHFFNNNSNDWMVTASDSRKLNMECDYFYQFYDNHDIWHFLSAMALFFSFMMLLTIDDELVSKPRDQIDVF